MANAIHSGLDNSKLRWKIFNAMFSVITPVNVFVLKCVWLPIRLPRTKWHFTFNI